jgi:small subunit ribosomal protein S17
MSASRSLKRTQVGIVKSDKNDKTVTVLVTRRFQHPIYGKFVNSQKKYMAHDPDNSCRIGDKILIEECRPLSRRKRWIVKDIIERAV